MLDENLPTFLKKPSTDNPSVHIVYLSQNGDEPSAEYIIKRPEPSLVASRNKYAVGLVDSFSQDVIYAEVLIEPEWSQPSLSAAELRSQNGRPPPPVPIMPDSFTIQLYNPDQQVTVRQLPASWNTRESWEFEMPQHTFRLPSASRVDREQDDPVASELTPKIMFRWRRDGRLSKDMTCYMTGKSLGDRKSKEPDITVALLKHRRNGDTALTVYEPNMQRVDVEDRKGLDIVLILGAEVIRDLHISPGPDPFNVASGPTITGSPPAAAGTIPSRRKNSRPSAAPAMSGVPAAAPSSTSPSAVFPSGQSPPADPRTQWEIDAETKRLQDLVAKEEREREREKREKAEQKRIRKMLQEEEKQRRKREDEVARETERLKKLYGVEGQEYESRPPPQLPPRPSPAVAPVAAPPGPLAPGPWMGGAIPPPPPRPVSVGPPAGSHGLQGCSILGALTGQNRPGHGHSLSSLFPQRGDAPSQVSGSTTNLSGRERRKMQKKRSVHF